MHNLFSQIIKLTNCVWCNINMSLPIKKFIINKTCHLLTVCKLNLVKCFMSLNLLILICELFYYLKEKERKPTSHLLLLSLWVLSIINWVCCVVWESDWSSWVKENFSSARMHDQKHLMPYQGQIPFFFHFFFFSNNNNNN